MKTPSLRVLGLLTILLLLALAAFQSVLPGLPGEANRGPGATNGREHEGKESPPEDWFIAQRVTHGGIPTGALEKAGAQAVALALETGRSESQQAAAKWKFVGPTNIGGRVVDIGVDPI